MAALVCTVKHMPSSSSCTFLPTKPSCPISFPRKNLTFRAEASKDDLAGVGAASRRNLLIGLGGLYGTAAGLATDGRSNIALGAPIQPPDYSQCGPADLPSGAAPVNCCPPVSSVTDFQLPPVSVPLRVRPAAHLVDDAYLKKYKKAVELMRNLPADDPRNFMQQANVHCAYCDGAYDQVGFPGVELQIHNSWLFFPWHRFYLYFNERILGKLIGDDTFALPFWNWDAPDGMKLPAIYNDASSSLFNPNRDQSHLPPTIIDLDFSVTPTTDSGQKLINDNLSIMYRQVISNGATAQQFMGEALRAGDQPNPGAGSLENVPHGPVHIWTGDPRQPNREDMGVFYSAGRDPIFFAHHSNIDRLWNVWKTLGGKRFDFTDTDWLDAGFLFYDENAKPVRVRVRDCVNTELLGYKYQDVPNPWENAKPARAGTGRSVKPKTEPTFPLTLTTANVNATVNRPTRAGRKGGEEEVIRLQGIEFDKSVFTKFDVYVNASSEAVLRPAVAECAGSFVHVPHLHGGKGSATITTSLLLGITELLGDVGATGDDSVVLTLVPRAGTVKIAGISIQLIP
ncbi:hypothetical protein KSP39_PZI003337 [Platanthera zijinensis]|uniref:Tyrosinase copper-binding domain-containing protein n=1 Tax=Platanthera zijinensis TaxID=2320716 RepID=A0AAP0BZ22_9ASPA